jgi:prepilin-type processing-associated H-X9-DG protein
MQIIGKFSRVVLLAASFAAGLIFSTGAMAQALNFHFQFTGNMSCMQPVPVSNAPIGGAGSGVLNPDGSVSAEITQTLLVFSTSLHFDSKLGSGLTSVPGGTAQVRVAGRQSLRFIWNLPNNMLVVTIAVRGQSCTANFQANLHPGKSQYTFFDGSTYHYCGRPVMTTSTCELR